MDIPSAAARPAARTQSLARSTAATFLAIVGIYQALIWAGLIPRNLGANQWEENEVRAEGYAFTRHAPDAPPQVVLVGSSLANNLATAGGWKEVVNLGMAGGASQTGLALLLSTPARPGVVVVEVTDTVARGTDVKLMEKFRSPWERPLLTALPALRTEYRPTGVVIRLLRSAGVRLGQALSRRGPAPPPAAQAPTPERVAIADRAVAGALEDMRQPLAPEAEARLREQATALRGQVDDLRRAGWRVVLVEIPRDSRLDGAPQVAQVRAILREALPPASYPWLPDASGQTWTTSDATHLTAADAARYVAFIRQQLAALPQQ